VAVADFSDALRRELDESPGTVLQIITPGVETGMLEEVREAYEQRLDVDRALARAFDR
jgi:short-subunit dehydrogenase